MKKSLLLVSVTSYFFFFSADANDSIRTIKKIDNGTASETKGLRHPSGGNGAVGGRTAPQQAITSYSAPFSILQALPDANITSESDVCGLSEEADPCIVPEAGYSMNPYWGEVFRSVLDLEFWGGAVPMVFKHYEAQKLRSLVNLPMQRSYTSSSPESYRATIGVYSFKSLDASVWSPNSTAGGRLIREGANYFLHTPDGYRYRFEEIALPPPGVPACTGCFELTDKCDTKDRQEHCGSAPCFVNCYRYQLKDFIDPYQREFKVLYDNQNKMLAVYGGMVPIHNYSWGMRRFVEAGSFKATIAAPEGKSYFFKGDASGTWQPTFKGQGAQLSQEGANYFLQMADGFRYHFEELPLVSPPLDCSVCSERSSSCPGCATQQQKPCFVQCYRYQLQDIEDPYKNKYKLTYTTDADKKLVKIEDPSASGRSFELKYNADKKLSTVETSDKRSVEFKYNSDGIFSGVDYGDQAPAVYNFDFTPTNVTHHFNDPRFDGTTSNMKVTTNYCGVPFPSSYPVPIVQMKNGLNDKLMTSLDNRSVDKKLTYEMGDRKVNKIYNMPNAHLLKAYTDGVQSKTTYEYEESDQGYLKKQTDEALSRSISYERTKYGNPTLITYSGTNGTESWMRDPESDLVTNYKNRMNYNTKYIRDPQKRWITRIEHDVDNSFEIFEDPDEFGQPKKHKRMNGGEESFVYDKGILKSESFLDTGPDPELKALPYTITYEPYPSGLLKSITNPRPEHFLTEYEYDNGSIKRGLLTKMTNPGGSYQDYKYDAFGSRTEFTNELRKTWKTEYDEFKRPTKVYTPIIAGLPTRPPTAFTYGLPGGINGCCYTEAKPTLVTLPTGKKTEMEYDAEWRKTRETVGLGTADAATTKFELDKVGRPEWTVDPRIKRWHRVFDEMDRVVRVENPLLNITTYTYDDLDRIKTITQDSGRLITKHGYNDVKRTDTTTIYVLGTPPNTTIREFDVEGNMIKLTDGNNHHHQFQYDQLNHLRKRVYPGSVILNEEFDYDEAGNLTMSKNRAGQIRRFTYDERNRLKTAIWDGSVAPCITYEYDDANRVKIINNGHSIITYEYNDANELMSETQFISGVGVAAKKVSYTYNDDGLRETVTYPSGYVLKYHYSGRNQVSAIEEVGSTKPRLAIYIYDLNGNRKQKIINNGTYVDYTYDDVNQLVTVEHKKGRPTSVGRLLASQPECGVNRIDYGYDNMGRVKYVQRNLFKGDVFEYDALDQVTKVQFNVLNPDGNPSSPDSIITYNLDEVSNRIGVTKEVFNDLAAKGRITNTASTTSVNANTTYITNELNQYYVINGEVLAYTKNGNLVSWDGWMYTYDAEGRMTKAEKTINGQPYTILFFYDALGRCVKRVEDGKTVLLYYDGRELIEERDINDQLLNRYTNGAAPNEILVKVAPENSNDGRATTVYYHHDKDRSVIGLSDGQGNDIEGYIYDLFGKPTIYLPIPPGSETPPPIFLESRYGNRFLFHGNEYLSRLKLYSIGDRMYSPDERFGRFLQANPGDVNSYIYAKNSPVNNEDEEEGRRDWWGIAGSSLGIIGNGIAAFGSAAFGLLTAETGVGAVAGFAAAAYFTYGVDANISNLVDAWHGRKPSSTGALFGDVAKTFAPENKALGWLAFGADLTAGIVGPAVIGKSLANAAKFTNVASEARTAHVISGEIYASGKFGGGHAWFRSVRGTIQGIFGRKLGDPSKTHTMFPLTWRNNKIMHAISEVLTSPSDWKIDWRQITGPQGSLVTNAGDPVRYIVRGFYEGVEIEVITTGRDIITAYPIK